MSVERVSPQPRSRFRPNRRKSRMVEISLSGSGEGLGWATSRGYSTTIIASILCKDFVQATELIRVPGEAGHVGLATRVTLEVGPNCAAGKRA
jgi:hypothetical protein